MPPSSSQLPPAMPLALRPARAHKSAADTGGQRRADIDGLRAIAVLLVVTYHVWWGRVSGGVDVFLFVSAFLLTDALTRRLERSGRVGLGAYWLRRFRGLLPGAAVVLVLVLVGTAVILPGSEWSTVWSQTWASMFYVQNVRLADAAVDYYGGAEALLSPLQHFWSLSVQGQVFVLWPVLIVAAWAVARKMRASGRTVLVMLFSIVFLASLAYSIAATDVDQQTAYFSTPARLWEFAAGSILALLLHRVRVTDAVSAAIGWLGMAGLLSCGIVLDVRGGFPGYLALWPVLSAAAVIVGGRAALRGGPGRLLAAPPLVWLSRHAYSLYLVHWPVLVFGLVLMEREQAGLWGGSLIIGVSIVAAVLLTALVTRFAHRPMPRRREVAVLAIATLVVLVPLGGWQGSEQLRAQALRQEAALTNPGAGVLLGEGRQADFVDDAPLLPLPGELDAEWVSLPVPCNGTPAVPDSLRGSCFRTDGLAAALGGTVVAIGDSHTQQLSGTLVAAADGRWRSVAILKGGCKAGADVAQPWPECDEWRETALRYALDLQPEAVMITVTMASPDSPQERLVPGIREVIDRFVDAGIRVVAVRDNPRFDEDMYACLEDNPTDEMACGRPVGDVLAQRNPAEALRTHPNITLVDFTPLLCPDGWCAARIGNVAVYRDDNHLTATYARSMAPFLADVMSDLW